MNIIGNYPVWEWERRCRPRDGGGVFGRTCRAVYNNVSEKDRSLEGLILDKNGQKPALGKNSFIFRAAQRPDGIRPRGSHTKAIRGFQRLSPKPHMGRDRRPWRPRAIPMKKPGAAPIPDARHTINHNRKQKKEKAPPRPPGASGAADGTKERSGTPRARRSGGPPGGADEDC
jgi:hypothetical protein